MGATKTVRVLLVEDHAAFRQALALLLTQDEESDLEVVAQAGSLAEARAALLNGHLDGRLDVGMIDLGLPDGDGSELIGELRRANPDVSVVVLSAAMGPGHVKEVVKAGAEAVLDKVDSIPTIAEEVRRLVGEVPPRQFETASTTSVCWAPIGPDPGASPGQCCQRLSLWASLNMPRRTHDV